MMHENEMEHGKSSMEADGTDTVDLNQTSSTNEYGWLKRTCENCKRQFNTKIPTKRWCNSGWCMNKIKANDKVASDNS